MRKIVSAVLLSAILLTGNIAFAQGSTLPIVKSSITLATADHRAKLAEIAHLQEKVRTNRTEILSMKKDASDAYKEAKSHMKGLVKGKDNLTSVQIKSLKESLDIITQDKQSLAGTIGEIQKETYDLKTARMEKNYDEVINSLNSIIAVQNKRLEDLQRSISDLNKAATL
ncbi:hypothetical protein [Desulfosporosinus sp. Sb-LF]|uniref:hypothetical protein n=1 Tax=Desulfosporosinus sp. Sb-LF TaxID=2560027 RepID=UPI00107FBD84|nr:hypothetical protein [Desulfosporosinus sp. Sb-LF]TGE33122.1 hypothetical protein E4K68_09870 [Desulfosporosinus sp. Sb-LF]